jgi:hypothetical protein
MTTAYLLAPPVVGKASDGRTVRDGISRVKGSDCFTSANAARIRALLGELRVAERDRQKRSGRRFTEHDSHSE